MQFSKCSNVFDIEMVLKHEMGYATSQFLYFILPPPFIEQLDRSKISSHNFSSGLAIGLPIRFFASSCMIA